MIDYLRWLRTYISFCKLQPLLRLCFCCYMSYTTEANDGWFINSIALYMYEYSIHSLGMLTIAHKPALRIEKETQKWIWDLGVNRRPSPYTHHTIMSIPKVIIKHFSLSNCVYVLVLLFPECYCLKVYLCTKLCRPQVLDIIL